MKWQIVFNRSTGLHRFHLEGGAYVGEHGGTERQGFGMMLLPTLVFSSQVKGARVLQVGREHDSFVASFTRQLHTKIPGVEGDEDKV